MSNPKRSGKKSFGNRSGGRSSGSRGGFGGRDGGRPRRDSKRVGLGKHVVTCDKCGTQCEVPFKPTGDKPVYCSDCFRKDGEGGRREKKPSISGADLDAIHEKLDKIIAALNVDSEEE